ncbi:SH2 domain [Trinorchestia longiramus]|nr:SH2 domain [Trinorchestia longiramus]
MGESFDPKDEASWYAGPMTRQAATDILMNEQDLGVFLVRDSTTIAGDCVLCVREDNKVSHYIINKLKEEKKYRIGDQEFPDLPTLLNFYKLHYLDTTPLTRPAHLALKQLKVICKYDFEGADPEDLAFKKGEILTILSKDEDQWWTACNCKGEKGSIPVPYVMVYDGSERVQSSTSVGSQQSVTVATDSTLPGTANKPKPGINQKLPAFARVVQDRFPNAYDKTALRLERGNIIKVTKTNMNGNWEEAGVQIPGSVSNVFPNTQTCPPNVIHANDCGRIEVHSTNSGTTVLCSRGCTSADKKDVGPKLENTGQLRDGCSLMETGNNNQEKGNKSSVACQSVQLSAQKPIEVERVAMFVSAEKPSDAGCGAHEGISRF